eukprot:Platyproteum_vivax@DN17555_c0_g1_i1.p2
MFEEAKKEFLRRRRNYQRWQVNFTRRASAFGSRENLVASWLAALIFAGVTVYLEYGDQLLRPTTAKVLSDEEILSWNKTNNTYNRQLLVPPPNNGADDLHTDA